MRHDVDGVLAPGHRAGLTRCLIHPNPPIEIRISNRFCCHPELGRPNDTVRSE
jgi:hypothetical protein